MSDVDEVMEGSDEEMQEDAEECDSALGDETEATNDNQEVYLPGKPLEEGEKLVCDPTAYVMLHTAQTGAPCLSFDTIKDNLGDNRDAFPLTAYIVAGSQSSQAHTNSIIVMKLSNMHRTSSEKNDDDDEDDDDVIDSDEEDEEKLPKMTGALIKHPGCVNRIRTFIHNEVILAAAWSELGKVSIWNLNEQIQAVDNEQILAKYNKDNMTSKCTPLFTFSGHQEEGFAVDWSSVQPGVLATGDCRKDIHLWTPTDSSWVVDQRPLVGHKASVEDIQWSPNERSVLASCSVDKTIRVWDARAPGGKACMITVDDAHSSDINVIHWNRREPFIVSGGDDGFLKIWDLRRIKDGSAAAIFKHHQSAVTSVEWSPHDSTVFASAGSDNQIALWDLSVEKDDERVTDIPDLPPQLLFIHMGQDNIKELHWHSQIPGLILSTAESGFNIFKTISV